MMTKKISPEECKPLRHKVLWPHIELEKDCVIDIDHRDDAIHIGAYQGDDLISICSLFEMTTDKLSYSRQYRLRAMATDPDFRGIGAGAAVVDFALQCVKDLGHEVLWCDAREVALKFYEKLGFRTEGGLYQVRNIGPHKLMYYPLK